MALLSNQQVINESPFYESASHFISLESMRRIAKHSFLVHKSVSYLDLNLLEYSFSKYENNNLFHIERLPDCTTLNSHFICTEESSKKYLTTNRSVLYRYNLDVSIELEKGEAKFKETKNFVNNHDSVLLNGVTVPSDLYERHLYQMITANLLKTEKLKFVKNILKVMKFIKVPENSLCFLNRCVEILYSQCADLNLVLEFTANVRLQESDLFFLKPHILEFFLRHGDCKDFNDREFHRRQKWINVCISAYKFEHVATLLKYYCTPRFSEYAYEKTKHSLKIACALTVEELERPVKLGWITKERNLLVLQILDIFYSNELLSSVFKHSRLLTAAPEALRLVWSSIPDLLVSWEELKLLYGNTKIRKDITRIHKFYKFVVNENVTHFKPRRLEDYCCVTIRRRLCENQRLPEGISELHLPSLLKSFLRFEQIWLK